VQGYSVDSNGDVDVSRLGDITIDYALQEAPLATTNVILGNNLSSDTAVGETVETQTGVYDEQGRLHSMNVRFTKTADNSWDYEVRYGGDLIPPPFTDTTGSISFNVDGSLATATPITVAWDAGYVGSDPSFEIDVSALTQYARLSNALVVDRDGHTSGALESYNIESDGVMWLNFTNGERRRAFQLVVGNVGNLQALENVGENFYATTPSSGDMTFGRAGREINTAIVSGALEQSNTDLATEFTDMIVAQRGYQASARVITTSDELLQEVVQLKR
jgi:flagellar hook protein FlgE